MCGIAGFISSRLNEEHLHLITRTLKHRGPDAEGYFFDAGEKVGLGHRRLSIIDLSEAANQPFYSQDKRYVMVYNGEVYNFREIADKYNIQPRTASDSEIILEAFAKNGVKCFNDFNGMFAFSIWDSKEKKMYICRDRIGIKPFYYYTGSNEFVFASELKSIQELLPKLSLNYEAISGFLYLGYIPHTQTIYSSCYKLLPGHYAIIDRQATVLTEPYWQLEKNIARETIKDEKKAKDQLAIIMEEAVQKCMISDVPLGIFLSGGVDSSLVAAMAQKHKKEKIKTFSIAFKESRYDESVYAQKVADHVNSEHYKFTVGEEEGIEIIHDFLDIYDEPFGDMSGIPTYLVSKLARKHVKVALCGDGADELFMGYGFYSWAKRLSNSGIKFLHPLFYKILNNIGKNKYKSKAYLFKNPEGRLKSNIFSQIHGNWSLIETAQLLSSHYQFQFNEELMPVNRILTAPEQQSYFDLKNYLPEELLTKVDRASMQHGLEVRVPYLDNKIIDFALNLDQCLKIKNGTQKYLLKQVLYDYVPAAYFDRPKWGFAVPIREWLMGKLSYLIDDYLHPDKIREAGILNNDMVQLQIKKFRTGEYFRYHRIWLLIILQKWLLEKHLTFTPENKIVKTFSK